MRAATALSVGGRPPRPGLAPPRLLARPQGGPRNAPLRRRAFPRHRRRRRGDRFSPRRPPRALEARAHGGGRPQPPPPPCPRADHPPPRPPPAPPAAVFIEEALEIAGRFSGEESVDFINGAFDAVRKALESRAAAG